MLLESQQQFTLNDDEESDIYDFNSFQQTPAQQAFSAGIQDKKDSVSGLATVPVAIAATVAATIDTFGTSLGILEDDDVEDYLAANLPTVGGFLEEHEGGVRLTADIVGSFIPAGLAIKGVRAGSFLNKFVNKATGKNLDKYFSTGLRNEQLFLKSLDKNKVLINKRFRNFAQSPAGKKIRSKAIGRSVADVAIEGIAADAAIIATMNSSEFILPPENSLIENAIFFGGFNVIFNAAGWAAARFTYNSTMTKLGFLGAKAQNPSGLPLSAAFGAINNRGPEATTFTVGREEAREELRAAREIGDQQLVENLEKEMSAWDERIIKTFESMANDSVIKDVTERYSLSPEERRTLLGSLDETGFFGSRSFEQFETGKTAAIESDLIKRGEIDKLEVHNLFSKLESLAEKKQRGVNVGADIVKTRKELHKLQLQMADNEKTVTLIREIDGTTSGASTRQDMFQDGDRVIVKNTDSSSVKVDGIELVSDLSGNIRIPSSVAIDELADVAQVSIASVDRKALLASTGFTDERALRAQMDSLAGHEIVTVADELLALRQSFGEKPFTVYKAKDKPALFSLTKNKEYNTPHTMTADAVFGVSSKGKLIATDLPNAPINTKGFSQLSFKVRTAASDLMQTTLERVNPRTFKGLEISKNAHHTQVDFVLALLEKHPELANGITAPGGILRTKEGLEYQSLHSKFEEFREIFHAKSDEFAKGDMRNALHLPTAARSLNLPVEDLAILEAFGGMLTTSIKDTNPLSAHAKNLGEFTDLLKSLAHAEPTAPVNPALRFRGDMQNLPRDRRPVIDLSRSTEFSREKLLEAVYAERALSLELLNKQKSALIVQAGLNSLKGQDAALRLIKEQLPEVFDGLRSEGILTKNIFTQEFRLRGTPTGQAIDTLAALWRKATDKQMGEIFKPHTPNINKLTRRANDGDLQLFMILRNAQQQGWDFDPVAVLVNAEGGVKKFQYRLLTSDRNAALWSKTNKGEAMPDGAMLPVTANPKQNVTVTQEAADSFASMNALSQQAGVNWNAIRVAHGLPPKSMKTAHLPPRQMAGKEVVYLVDSGGNVVSSTAAETKKEAERLARAEIEANNGQLAQIPASSVQRQVESRSGAWFDLTDVTRLPKQTGAAKGTQAGKVVLGGVKEYRAIIKQLEAEFGAISRETRLFVFKPEADFLKFQHAASGFGPKDESTFSLLYNRILGTQQEQLDVVPSKVYNAIESSYDWLLQRIWDAKIDVGGRIGAQREYTQIQDKLGSEFAPFNSFNDFLVNTADVSLPPSFKKHAAALNEFTTALTIRMFDIGMPIINIASLASTLPPVIHAMKRMENIDESEARWLERTGIFTDQVGSTGVRKLSAIKATIGGIQFFFSKEGQEFAAKASRMGMFDQFAAEEVKFYGQIGEGLVSSIARKVADKTSILTDKSERLARAMSFMVFANMGKKFLKLESDEAVMAFANRQANNVIADFRPDNRPIIFQGAVGMPLGLFTTFLWNFLQRQYSMIESKQIGALINQVGLQTAIFGAESYPGVAQFLNQFSSAMGDGSENLIDRLNKQIGHEATSLFLNGSLSTMTGISVAPRAAIGLPGERGLFGAQSAAGVQYAAKVFRTVGQTVDSIIENEGISVAEMTEIVARSNLNKGLSNALELAQGRATDAQGSIIEDDTRTALGIGARAFGFKPLFADELRQENRRNRTTDSIRNELKERLANSMKAKIRSGSFTSDDFELAVASYRKAGGQAENFRRFFLSQITRGTTNKLDLEIEKAMRNSSDKNRIARLLFLSE